MSGGRAQEDLKKRKSQENRGERELGIMFIKPPSDLRVYDLAQIKNLYKKSKNAHLKTPISVLRT